MQLQLSQGEKSRTRSLLVLLRKAESEPNSWLLTKFVPRFLPQFLKFHLHVGSEYSIEPFQAYAGANMSANRLAPYTLKRSV